MATNKQAQTLVVFLLDSNTVKSCSSVAKHGWSSKRQSVASLIYQNVSVPFSNILDFVSTSRKMVTAWIILRETAWIQVLTGPKGIATSWTYAQSDTRDSVFRRTVSAGSRRVADPGGHWLLRWATLPVPVSEHEPVPRHEDHSHSGFNSDISLY